ncbi:hypothetical protein TIFTF001_035599 [Ficus carica]|uniref:Uncharacterized protein n=1 Tax=Ficus carica TaxID=3494 RepID=A0AA88E2J7_FICCA|nr:hypothetical protein TIFTF001_035599 [Ficus carica]
MDVGSNLLLRPDLKQQNLGRSITACSLMIIHMVGFGPWFELDWAGHPNHSVAARHVVLAERKLTTYIYAVDRARWKQPIEDNVVEWTNSNSGQSNSGDEEWASVFRRSKAEYESLQMQEGAETSNDAS